MSEPPRWFYQGDGGRLGPVSRSELLALLQARRLSVRALVWSPGMANWVAAIEVPSLMEALPPRLPDEPPPLAPDPASTGPRRTSEPRPASVGPAPAGPAAPRNQLARIVALSALGGVVVFALALVVLQSARRAAPSSAAGPIGSASPASAPADGLPNLVSRVQPSVVTIRSMDTNGDTIGQGSGFFVTSDGELVTNWHVLQGATSADVTLSDGTVLPISGVREADSASDLVQAQVDVGSRAVPALEFAEDVAPVGATVVVVGSPMGLEQSVTSGIVSAVREGTRYGTLYQIDAPISHGSSGSPVVDAAGKVIGVATLMLAQGQNLNFAVSARSVAALGHGGDLRPLSTVQPRERDARVLAAWQRGRTAYWRANCHTCHGPNRKGTTLAPDLTDSEWIHGDGSVRAIARIIRDGVPVPEQYPAPMPPFGGARLSNDDFSALVLYVYSWSP